ncbi:MAG TPA: chorismate synthase [Bacteroidales bacterium]|nr:chorismate synthase [Bacteroidales bacterium]HRZ49338.1 chorismate synthase [Bacteroidales bacterium]
MSGNTIGKIFRLTTFGESHGPATGGVIDGCPAGIRLDTEAICREVENRRAVKARHSTSRLEDDQVQYFSGIFEGVTTGAPIGFLIPNQKQDPDAYNALKTTYRPGHGDFSWHRKYGIYDYRGGGRYSARETLARVVAGAIARQLLQLQGIEIQGWVSAIGKVVMDGFGPYPKEDVLSSELRCPDPEYAVRMSRELAEAISEGDTLGGSVTVRVEGLMAGLGEPVFEKIEALLAFAVMSIPAVKAFELGDGFTGTTLRGSQQNDPFTRRNEGTIGLTSNHAGGTLGGLTSGSPLVFRVGFKPVSSIKKRQQTVSHEGEPVALDLSSGRHDVCVVPRAVAVVEAMTAITLADLWLQNRCSRLAPEQF